MDDQDVVKDIRDFKRRLTVDPEYDYGMRIYAIAVARLEELNRDLNIPTQPGDPICDEAHDLVRDCYYTYGVDFVDLGEVPISMSVRMEDVCGWEVDVPIPLNVLRRYMTDEQKLKFNRWKQRYRSKEYEVKLMQIRNVY